MIVGEAESMKLPYGEWLKSSPMKHVQIVPGKGRYDNDTLRRSLFRHKQEDGVSGENKEEETQPDVSDIMKSLKKVQVREDTHEEETHNKQEQRTKTDLLLQTKAKEDGYCAVPINKPMNPHHTKPSDPIKTHPNNKPASHTKLNPPLPHATQTEYPTPPTSKQL